MFKGQPSTSLSLSLFSLALCHLEQKPRTHIPHSSLFPLLLLTPLGSSQHRPFSFLWNLSTSNQISINVNEVLSCSHTPSVLSLGEHVPYVPCAPFSFHFWKAWMNSQYKRQQRRRRKQICVCMPPKELPKYFMCMPNKHHCPACLPSLMSSSWISHVGPESWCEMCGLE